jgi:hypothetical protein
MKAELQVSLMLVGTMKKRYKVTHVQVLGPTRNQAKPSLQLLLFLLDGTRLQYKCFPL